MKGARPGVTKYSDFNQQRKKCQTAKGPQIHCNVIAFTIALPFFPQPVSIGIFKSSVDFFVQQELDAIDYSLGVW